MEMLYSLPPWRPSPSAWAPAAPSALAISEAWLDDRAPDGRVVSGSSRAFTIDWEQQRRGLLSHQGSLVQISNGNREAAALCTVTKKKMQVLLLRPSSLPLETPSSLCGSCRPTHYFHFKSRQLQQLFSSSPSGVVASKHYHVQLCCMLE